MLYRPTARCQCQTVTHPIQNADAALLTVELPELRVLRQRRKELAMYVGGGLLALILIIILLIIIF
jgi:hypothetical protein